MKLDIVIPTRNRLEKLHVCLTSIWRAILELKNTDTNIKLGINSEKEIEFSSEELYQLTRQANDFIVISEYKAPNFWNSYLKNMKADVLCYLNDDIKLDKNCLKEGLKELASLDYDGVVGFYQSNQLGTSNCNAAFGLIGSKFADRFPDRKVFCEDYYCLYIDEELMKYASSINRFIGSTTATLEHYHPAFTKEQPDDTNIWLRRNKKKDIQTYNIRKLKNLVWGESFERVRTD